MARPKKNELDNKRSLSSYKISGYDFNYIESLAYIWGVRFVDALRWIIRSYKDEHPIESEIDARRKKLEADKKKLDEYIEICNRNRASAEAQIKSFIEANKNIKWNNIEAADKVLNALKMSIMLETGIGEDEFNDVFNKIREHYKA
jgi:hypothetical protein